VVNNILDFSKLEAGQVTPEAIDFSVERLINSPASSARASPLDLKSLSAPGLRHSAQGGWKPTGSARSTAR
jgi:hypothetical protein